MNGGRLPTFGFFLPEKKLNSRDFSEFSIFILALFATPSLPPFISTLRLFHSLEYYHKNMSHIIKF